VVVVKDKSGNFVRCYCVYAESSKTVKEAFEADKNMKQLMESLICDMSVMDMNVSSFKGMELSFVVDKEVSKWRETIKQFTLCVPGSFHIKWTKFSKRSHLTTSDCITFFL